MTNREANWPANSYRGCLNFTPGGAEQRHDRKRIDSQHIPGVFAYEAD